MPRQRRHTPAGMVFHIINRGVGRQMIFHKEEDYATFERVMAEAWYRLMIRILSYCLMPNHCTSCFGRGVIPKWVSSPSG